MAVKKNNCIQTTNILFGNNLGRNGFINTYVDNIDYGFEFSPSYERVTKNDNLSTFYDVWITDENSYKKDIEEKQITMKPNQPINRGEYINRSDGKWLVIDHDKQYSWNEKGRIKKCNYLLQWKNPEGSIISRWCVITNEINQSIAVDETNYMRLGEGKYEISLPDDNETRRLNRDKRFIWENLAYRVTSTNRTTRPGLQVLMVQEHQINTITDLIYPDGTGIANYYGNTAYTIDITNLDISISSGNTAQLNWVVKYGGIIVTDKTVVFSSSNTSVATVNSSGLVTGISNGSCVITASLQDNNAIYDTINISVVSSPSQNIVEQISGADSISNGLTSDYSIYKYIDFVIQTDTYTWSITGDASIVSYDGNHATVQANSNIGTCILQAQNNISGSIFTKTITLTNMW